MGLSRRRRIGMWSAVVAGTIVAVLAIFAIWTARQLLNDSNWTKTSSELIADPAIQTALSDFLVDDLYTGATITATLEDALPPRLDPLAKPAAGALREPLKEAVRRLLSSPRVQALWTSAARLTHQQFINLVEERGKALRTPSGGGVVLDLRPILIAVGDRLGIPLTGERLPPDAGKIVILTPHQLEALQRIVKLLKTLAIVLFVLSVALYALAIWLARGRRREVLAVSATALIVGAIVVLLLRRLTGNLVVDHLAKTSTVADAADAAWRIGTSLLAQVARTALVLALLLAIAAWLAGPARWAEKARHWMRPALDRDPALIYAAVLAVLLGALTLGIVPGIRTLAAAIILLVVVVAGVAMVRHQALAEPRRAATGKADQHD